MKSLLPKLLFLCALGVASVAVAAPFNFSVMGDVPYGEQELALLVRQVDELPRTSAFVIHLGDIKDGTTPCDEAVYARVSGVLRRSVQPTFIIPGDNEWNDCDRPKQAWRFWTKHFLKLDEHWKQTFTVTRQKSRPENFAFTHEGALFVGITMVGGAVHDKSEWKDFLKDGSEWVEEQFKNEGEKVKCAVVFAHAFPTEKHHGIFADRFPAAARKFGKPVLYLQGDGHVWLRDQPFENATNVTRVQVDQGGKAPPIVVTVTGDAKESFRFDRRLNPAR